MEHILLAVLVAVQAYIVARLFVDQRISVVVAIIIGLLFYWRGGL